VNKAHLPARALEFPHGSWHSELWTFLEKLLALGPVLIPEQALERVTVFAYASLDLALVMSLRPGRNDCADASAYSSTLALPEAPWGDPFTKPAHPWEHRDDSAATLADKITSSAKLGPVFLSRGPGSSKPKDMLVSASKLATSTSGISPCPPLPRNALVSPATATLTLASMATMTRSTLYMAKKLFLAADTNQDGRVDFVEFVNWVTA